MDKAVKGVLLVSAIAFFGLFYEIYIIISVIYIANKVLGDSSFAGHSPAVEIYAGAVLFTSIFGPYLCIPIIILAVALLRDVEIPARTKTVGIILAAACVFSTAVVVWQIARSGH